MILNLYGGNYARGGITAQIVNPKQIVEKGKVIFVAVQFRSGALGYLFTGKDSEAPGNMGLLDQVKYTQSHSGLPHMLILIPRPWH